MLPKTMRVTGGWGNGQMGSVGGVVLMELAVVPLTFWVADVFSRMIDERAVRFARWVCQKAFMKV